MDMQMDLNAAKPRVLEGGAGVDFDAQERAWYAGVASDMRARLKDVHPLHPMRDELMATIEDFRSASGKPLGPALELAG